MFVLWLECKGEQTSSNLTKVTWKPWIWLPSCICRSSFRGACLVFNLQVVGHPGEARGHAVIGKADLGHVRSSSSGYAGCDACQNAAGIKGKGLKLQCDRAGQQACLTVAGNRVRWRCSLCSADLILIAAQVSHRGEVAAESKIITSLVLWPWSTKIEDFDFLKFFFFIVSKFHFPT